jgi:hypothetical protein
MADPRFATQMQAFWRDTFKLGGTGLDTAPNFAAQLVVENRSYMELFTASSNSCPTFDPTTGTFTAATCTSGVPTTAGVLTDPNVMKQYYSNFGFRRVRWVQETFACTRFPAEVGPPQNVGGAASYTGLYAFNSIAGGPTAKVNFLDTSSVICANCHSDINHMAPLFGHFDQNGMYNAAIVTKIPVPGAPTATLADYLPAGETFQWRHGLTGVADIAGLGAQIAADPDVAQCAVARVWDWAMGKGDIVASLALVPSDVIATEVADFSGSGYKLRGTIKEVFTAQNFIKF